MAILPCYSTSCKSNSSQPFEELKKVLHFSDNYNATTSGKINKICPLVDKLNERIHVFSTGENLAVDEQIVPFKGYHSMKQYNPKKPHKWGFKVFVLSGASGFSYKFEVFTGASDNVCTPDEPDLGASSYLVVKLVRHLQEKCNYTPYIDNQFKRIGLNVYMHQKGIQMVGIVRKN